MSTRPTIAVRSLAAPDVTEKNIPTPEVFCTPIRSDLVRFVHKNLSKNHRQPYGVSPKAGHQTSAESWGTGRAVARIPRVKGSGTHRSGQAAFGNMCRGGHMFAPTKVWRRWHRKVPMKLRRHAVASALAASSETALVMARGHKIDEVPEIPLVVSDDLQSLKRTKEVVKFFEAAGLGADQDKAVKSNRHRAGIGKMRNRRKVHKLGPLLIVSKDDGITKASANLKGVEVMFASSLNLLRLAPGGAVGRLIVWTESAIAEIEARYGDGHSIKPTFTAKYALPRAVMTNTDLTRIINSDEIQNALRRKRTTRV